MPISKLITRITRYIALFLSFYRKIDLLNYFRENNNYRQMSDITQEIAMKSLQEMTMSELKTACKERKIKKYGKLTRDELVQILEAWSPPKDPEDEYTEEVLRSRMQWFYMTYDHYKQYNLPLRCINFPEDISENMVKFIIRNFENDPSCKWAKCIGKSGDLASANYPDEYPIEVKGFTSDGPSQFGPSKKFGVIYFLDARNWRENKYALWKVSLTNESPEIKSVIMNKKKGQTFEDQCGEGRRPHINWDSLYPQIRDHCTKIYEGSFEGIFNKP